jgi:hypothetical protein
LSVLEDRPAAEIAADIARPDTPRRVATDSLEEELAAELSRGDIRLAPGADLQQAIHELRPLVAGVAPNTLQSTALLSARFVRLTMPSPASRTLLRGLCDRVLAKGGLTLQILPEETAELWRVAGLGDPKSPDAVLGWIMDHTERAQGGRAGGNDPRSPEKHAGPSNVSGGPAK